jgi:Matrixin
MVAIGFVHLQVRAEVPAAGAPSAPLEAVAAPPCASAVRECFGLRIHLARDGQEPVVAPEWVAASLAVASTLFAPIGVGFEVATTLQSEGLPTHIGSRKDRDALGRSIASDNVIDVFLVKSLADLEDARIPRLGVHWRVTDATARRFIIVSAAAHERVLAHELGHFFGLPHSSYAISIMNKTERKQPPLETRRFADEELPILERTLREIIKRKELSSRPHGQQP